jgi:hypothetical protein
MTMYGLPKDFDYGRLGGRFLEQLCFGIGQIQLRFDQRVTIAVTSSLVYRQSPTSHPKTIEIADLPIVRSNLLDLLHHTITDAFGSDEGTLTLEFDDGQVLQFLDPDPHYEAYEIHFGDEQIIV